MADLRYRKMVLKLFYGNVTNCTQTFLHYPPLYFLIENCGSFVYLLNPRGAMNYRSGVRLEYISNIIPIVSVILFQKTNSG